MEIVPRDFWEGLFRSQGMKTPLPRIQMLDGFNEGWIEFESGEAGSQKGSTSLESGLKSLIDFLTHLASCSSGRASYKEETSNQIARVSAVGWSGGSTREKEKEA